MKKIIISKLVPMALVTILVFPAAVQAKEMNSKSIGHGQVKNYQGGHMNAMWSRFQVELQGDGEGETIKITDTNPLFDYELASDQENGSLANGDPVIINVINRGGNIVKQLNYSIGLGEVDEAEQVHLYATNQDLDTTYGAARFLNFNNLASGSEVYLTDAQEKLGTTDRTAINFHHGTTIDGDNPNGDWEDRNKLCFGYDSKDGKFWVELKAEYEYRAEYDTLKDVDFDAIQLMLLKGESDSVVKLENIKVNGKVINDTVLVGDSDWSKWNLEGDIQNSNGNFAVEADLVITGESQGETNKLEVAFGRK